MRKILAAVIVLVSASVNSNAQVTATASASATIVSPITITKNADMDFGNIAVSATTGGTVTLLPNAAGQRNASVGGGVSFPAITGTVSAAEFLVNGQANYTYDITLPASAVIENGLNFMDVQNFTSSVPTGTLDGTGAETFYVGADLVVNAAQAPGVYTTSTPFFVAVNYN